MTLELYVSINGQDYERLDLMDSESINIKYIYKDTQDLSKIYSPYSQSFALQGSLNNQRILGFLGETKVVKTKTNNNFDCKIYNNGLLSKKGLLKITEARYENGIVKSFTGNLTTSLQSLKDRMGEDTLVNLPIKNTQYQDTYTTINWSSASVNFYLNNGVTKSIYGGGNGVNFIVPFISNNRIWQLADINDLTKLDNIAFNPNTNKKGSNFVKVSELSPAIQFRTIIDLIKIKYDLDIILPLEEKDYYNDLYICCNKIENSFNSSTTLDIVNAFQSIAHSDINEYSIGADYFNNVIQITANYNIQGNPGVSSSRIRVYDLFITFNFFNFQNTRSDEDVNFSIFLERTDGFSIANASNSIKSKADKVEFFIPLPLSAFVGNKLNFKVKIQVDNPVVFDYHDIIMGFTWKRFDNWGSYRTSPVRRASFHNRSPNNNLSKIDLFQSLPEIKVVDFLSSFLKTFNISVFETSPDDGRLYWLTPEDIQSENKEYSRSEVDYTAYVTDGKVNKKIANDYNYYNFKHKTSKYFSNDLYLKRTGIEYGQITYPTVKPIKKLNEFKIETNFCIAESVKIKESNLSTIYGFTKDTPNKLSSGALRYKPNTEDLTLFFLNGNQNQNTKIGYLVNYTDGSSEVKNLAYLHLVSSVHKSGFSLGFGLIESATQESLYENFYKEQTERLLEPNTLQSTFTLELPQDELVLNYANTNQGESNIPSGFRLQNDIIIGETRYSIIDAVIDQTTGKTTLNLLNYV